jgi:hypothetical protein
MWQVAINNDMDDWNMYNRRCTDRVILSDFDELKLIGFNLIEAHEKNSMVRLFNLIQEGKRSTCKMTYSRS